jgi:uncharacterized protein YdeI (YjbR/CyaY-like superfamily)
VSVEIKNIPNQLKMNTSTDYEIISFVSPQEFENWQEQNHDKVNGIWIRFFKKGSGIKTIIYDEALNVALCYGWIDGQLKKYDETSYIQKFTPRRPKSMWSKRNVDKVASLEKEGKIKPSGWKAIESAKADGRWEISYDSATQMVVPDDFILEISKNQRAYKFFKTLNKTNLFTIGYRLQTAKDLETRLKRIKVIIEKLEKEEKFH